ncbi:unnamed protein product [Durusdinium trenchii]|uniref:Uncharacterized protein n=1 Tax=Durusdinium trenchii TaxID=1381693 RepID=A0ABP0QPY1_9DINO
MARSCSALRVLRHPLTCTMRAVLLCYVWAAMAVRDVRNSMSVEGGYCMARDKTNTGMVGICEKKAYRDCGGDCFWKDDKDWGFCMARDKTNQRMVGACAKKAPRECRSKDCYWTRNV